MSKVLDIPRMFRFVVGLSLSLLLLGGCTPSQSTVTTDTQPIVTSSAIAVPTFSTLDAYNLIQKNKDNSDFIIIDVRTVDEFNSGHIANAINIDYYSPDFESIIGKLDRNRQYLVYCRTGIRGAAATQIMVGLDFKEVHNLSGGIIQWIQDGYTIVN